MAQSRNVNQHPVTNWVPNKGTIKLNIDPRYGFFRLSQISGKPDSEWKKYAVDINGQIKFLSWGIIPETLGVASIISTLDGGYAIVYANVTNSSSIDPNGLFAVRLGLYAIFISRNQQTPSIPYILFQTSLSEVNATFVKCSVNYVRVGHICILTIEHFKITNFSQSPLTPFFNPMCVKVRFLSSGSVLSSNTSEYMDPNSNISVYGPKTASEYFVTPLTYG
ncbi:36703_t:CDS:2, partial [Racocetra persica]